MRFSTPAAVAHVKMEPNSASDATSAPFSDRFAPVDLAGRVGYRGGGLPHLPVPDGGAGYARGPCSGRHSGDAGALWWRGEAGTGRRCASLLSLIVPYIGIAIIVLFQTEIRRTLARIGRKRWLGLVRGFKAPEDISEILMALEQFAERRTGALIVLERDIGLRTFVESGLPLDSRISRDLLLSIFQPPLPLHDGAVIIQKDRIAAAACFLPLTTNAAISLKLGTRHRAGHRHHGRDGLPDAGGLRRDGPDLGGGLWRTAAGVDDWRGRIAHQPALRRSPSRRVCG